MTNLSFSLLHVIHTMAGAYHKDDRSDADLLARYAECRDEKAFATLMVRHGPLVYNACRCILGNPQDVEEACQITFLALAQNAGKIRVTDTVGGWLHHVAYRAALKARRAMTSRTKLQKRLQAIAHVEEATPESLDEIHEVLHEEIEKLPEKLRVATVLHFLEGETIVGVANILGVKKSTVGDRLNQAKARLKKRFDQRGLVLGVAALNALLAKTAASASLPSGLVAKTMQAATDLHAGKLTSGLARMTEELLKQASGAPSWWKAGWMITLLCASGLVGVTVGGIAWKQGFFDAKEGRPFLGKQQESLSGTEEQKPNPPRLDIYGDPLPKGALVRLGTSRLRPATPGSYLAFTHDGKGLLLYGSGGPTRICDVATGRVLRSFGQDLRGVALSHDGRVLAGRSPDNSGGLRLWDPRRGKLLRQIDAGNMDWNANLAVSPNGAMVVSAGHHSNTAAWEVATGTMLWERKKDSEYRWLLYSADSKHVLAVHDGEMLLLDALTGVTVQSWRAIRKGGKLIRFACTSDGRITAMLYHVFEKNDPTRVRHTLVSVRESTTGKEINTFSLQVADMSNGKAIAISPDGKTLATGGDARDKVIRLWDVENGKERAQCRCQYAMHATALAFSPSGKMVAAYNSNFRDQTVHLWNVDSTREITPPCDGHRGPVLALAFTKDGKEIVSGAIDGELRVWNSASGAQHACWGGGGAADSSLWPERLGGFIASDGQEAATVEFKPVEDENVLPSTTLRIFKREGERGREITRFPVEFSWNYQFSFSSVDKLLAYSGVWRKQISLINVSTGKLLQNFPGERPQFSTDGKILAVQENGKNWTGYIHLWNVQSSKKLCTIEVALGNNCALAELAFSPDKRTLAVNDTDATIRLWRLYEESAAGLRVGGAQVIKSEPESRGRRRTWIRAPVAFSPDGRMIATSDRNGGVRICETATCTERLRLEGHDGGIETLLFAPDGRRLATGSRDESALVWDLTGGRLAQTGDMIASRLASSDEAACWQDLIHDDARRAARAIWAFASAGDSSLTFLKERLMEKRLKAGLTKSVDRKLVTKLIADLDASAFTAREQARQKLAVLGDAVESAIVQALRESPSAEKRLALQRLLEPIQEKRRNAFAGLATGEELRTVRVIEVLGQIATPAADKLLQTLSVGEPTALSTMAAKAALQKRSR